MIPDKNHTDLRIRKTHMALYNTLTSFLAKVNFNKITVNDICKESLISRAAFYSHFSDKYDLLRWWLAICKPPIKPIKNDYIEFNKTINDFVGNNRNIIWHLLEEVNSETFELLIEFSSMLLSEFIGDDNAGKKNHLFNDALYRFCAGGIISLVLWQIKNNPVHNLEIEKVNYYIILDAIRELEKTGLEDAKKEEKNYT